MSLHSAVSHVAQGFSPDKSNGPGTRFSGCRCSALAGINPCREDGAGCHGRLVDGKPGLPQIHMVRQNMDQLCEDAAGFVPYKGNDFFEKNTYFSEKNTKNDQNRDINVV